MFVSVKSLTALIDQDIQFYIDGVASKEQHSPEEFEKWHKYIMVATNEQIERSKARRKAIESLEYNPMCYNCKSFGKSCKGSMNKIYSGCVHREVDESKPSIYAQIEERIK